MKVHVNLGVSVLLCAYMYMGLYECAHGLRVASVCQWKPAGRPEPEKVEKSS